MNDPAKVQVLHHAKGLQPSASLANIYKNQVEHDPLDIDRARELASQQDVTPVGILYQNPEVPCYEDLLRTGRIVTPALTRAGLNAELDKYTVWPESVKEALAHA